MRRRPLEVRIAPRIKTTLLLHLIPVDTVDCSSARYLGLEGRFSAVGFGQPSSPSALSNHIDRKLCNIKILSKCFFGTHISTCNHNGGEKNGLNL
ncbi:hypothetical protein QBC47DRAFT_379560 [Echria macrotheca]|uniref:Uncharacterized protein n=1 Tax=Echria macrotheca TaxID=438768 RepID=A0AAJ0BDY6_9PEZI|nr:hypothetical protein QBC47DRAFT_379560 [Echria macrotheca]